MTIEWMAEQGEIYMINIQVVLRKTKYKKLWKVIIAQDLKGKETKETKKFQNKYKTVFSFITFLFYTELYI